jgi:hypothetical protein
MMAGRYWNSAAQQIMALTLNTYIILHPTHRTPFPRESEQKITIRITENKFNMAATWTILECLIVEN